MDENNFSFELNSFEFRMQNGKLEVNGIEYEELDDDPTYMLVRAYYKLADQMSNPADYEAEI